MSTIFQRAGASYSANARRFMAPVRDGLAGWWYLGGLPGDDAATATARTIKNLANFGDTLALVGSPTIGTGYVEVDNTHYCVTNIPETESFTYLYLGFPTGDTFNSAFVNNTSGPGVSAMLYTISVAPTRAAVQIGEDVSGTPTQTVAANITVSPWATNKFISTTVDGVGLTAKIRNCTDSTVASSPLAHSRSVRGLNLKFGGNTVVVDGARLGFVALYNRALTDDEIDAVHAMVAAWRLSKYSEVI